MTVDVGVFLIGVAAIVGVITYSVATYVDRRRSKAWVAWPDPPKVEGAFREPPPDFGVEDLWQ